MADSLFDNRYRYDYIYPRGRSGETLRAVDTLDNDRPVVIKRPASNDAPPIRAGQEVSILNERKALKRLSGHPALTEVVGEGQFFVGGVPHQYIVMERATGMIVADTVLTLSRNGGQLPRLEMLVIIDALLDLLAVAHAQDIIYNDVDAKHLFWSRESYRLKVIDWGNAVFLEGDDVTPQGISRQTDVFQVGELLYFILSGGGRADVPRDAGTNFIVDLDDDVSMALRRIISKALHPKPNLRYPSIDALRKDLTDYRRPLERERDATVSHTLERLRRELSKTELRSLTNTLEPALKLDPGYPDARKARTEIDDRLRDLDVSADLDAVHIYMTAGNWSRAADLLNELRDKAGPRTTRIVELSLDVTLLMLEAEIDMPPAAIADAINMLYEGHMVRAAHALLTQDTPDDTARKYQWLMAERISSRVPEILLLRPNLYRLELALSNLASNGTNLNESRDLLKTITHTLDSIPDESNDDLAQLRDNYRAVVDQLQKLNKLLSTVMVQERLSNNRLPLSSLDRATNAAMALADNMHVIGKQAAGSPRDAMVALDNSRSIAPTNPLWDRLSQRLNALYDLLQSYQTYVPAADGSDLADWLMTAQNALTPYTNGLSDEMLTQMVEGLAIASDQWQQYAQYAISGNRDGAINTLATAANAVHIISPTLSGWLNQLQTVIDGAAYVQRHALFGGLGRALADGYEAFDRGKLTDAEQLGGRALEIATNEHERDAAQRLADLSRLSREWVERRGIEDRVRSQAALNQIEALYSDEELREREKFAMQMPTRETYLKAMNKGLVSVYQKHSTPALRIYFINVILLGALEAHEQNLDDARFWQDAATRALEDYGPKHSATHMLEDFIKRRVVLNAASEKINQINSGAGLEHIAAVKRLLNEDSESKTLEDAQISIRELENALREWDDGDFRTAGLKLENAINAANDAQKTADIKLDGYLAFLRTMQQHAAELHNAYRQMRQIIERRPEDPDPAVANALERAATTTENLLGEPYFAQLKTWNDTYQQFLSVYTDDSIRRSAKLERFNELFKAMFIDRHPAYVLYRHWYDTTERSPEFPAPPTDEPTPRVRQNTEEDDSIYLIDVNAQKNEARPAPMPAQAIPWRRVIIGLIVVGVLIAGGLFVVTQLNNDDPSGDNVVGGIALTLPETPDAQPTEAETDIPTETIISTVAPSNTPTDIPTATDPATATPEATATPTATATATATETPIPTATLTPTLPPQGIQGSQELLTLFERIPEDDLPWDETIFAPAQGSSGWSLGTADATDGDEIQITLAPETLDIYYGNSAPARIRRTEATIAFTTYNPSVVPLEDIYFGILLQSVNDPSLSLGISIQVVNLNTVNIYIREGDEITFNVQRSANAIDPRLRIERDAVDGDVTLFFNDFQIGEPLPFLAPEAQIQPILFVTDGGVLVNVTSWQISLR